jgi:hypothetical protein
MRGPNEKESPYLSKYGDASPTVKPPPELEKNVREFFNVSKTEGIAAEIKMSPAIKIAANDSG